MKLFEIAPGRNAPMQKVANKTPKFQYSLDLGSYTPTGFDNYYEDPLKDLTRNPLFQKHVNEAFVDNTGSDQFDVCLMVDPGSEQQIAKLLDNLNGTDIEFVSEMETDPNMSPDEANMLVFCRFDWQSAAGEESRDEASYQKELAAARAERL